MRIRRTKKFCRFFNVPKGFTIHHRNPESLGGKTIRENVSIVLKSDHRAWTTLFDSHPPIEVARLFSKYWKMFGNEGMVMFALRGSALAILDELEQLDVTDEEHFFTNEELVRKRNIQNRHKYLIRKGLAWKRLFEGMSLEEIISQINDVWIDPEYRLIVEVQAKKVFVKKS